MHSAISAAYTRVYAQVAKYAPPILPMHVILSATSLGYKRHHLWRIAVPTYHYRCRLCGFDFTEQQSFTDDPITVCPQCGEEQVRKVYAAPSIEFKGSGFYRTDGNKSK